MANFEIDWQHVVHTFLVSRQIDLIEETELYPQRKILYQFSAGGHELIQIVLGSLLRNPHDAGSAYYRSRPFLLSVGLPIEDAIAGPLAKSGGFSDGRDIGVVCNLPQQKGPIVLPMSGDVGSQYTPSVGWAQAITYHRDVLNDASYRGAIAVVLGGEGSVATNGFWSALTIATTLKLPLLFLIEDNSYAISVSSAKQTPGGNIANNLASFANLKIVNGDGTDPQEVAQLLGQAVEHVRQGAGPAMAHFTVPRLCGHSGQDTQAYKPAGLVDEEKKRDPLPRLKQYLVPKTISEDAWIKLENSVKTEVAEALEKALNRDEPDAKTITRHVFFYDRDGNAEIQQVGGLYAAAHKFPPSSTKIESEPTRTNMLTAIRRTLEFELTTNPKVLVFGEDVGPKGGVHGATLGLQERFGESRVFDTSLSEEGIIGRAVGLAINGLLPVAEIQFRKYADPATEQLNNCGTIRWRTANRFAAPIVVRIPGGFAKCGDPWHSVSNEVMWAHAVGWQVAYPSNAEDAVGLLRAAMRSNNPTIFFEHRALLDAPWARRPYPGDQYLLPLGKGKVTKRGEALTLVTWGAMVERCELAADNSGKSVEVIDLRTISPWDKDLVLDSVKKTRRCMVVYEDTMTAGFGAEVCTVVAGECFMHLDAPIKRLATPDVPIPYNVALMDAVLPSVNRITEQIIDLVEF